MYIFFIQVVCNKITYKNLQQQYKQNRVRKVDSNSKQDKAKGKKSYRNRHQSRGENYLKLRTLGHSLILPSIVRQCRPCLRKKKHQYCKPAIVLGFFFLVFQHQKKVEKYIKKPTSRGVPRRSPIQVLTAPNVA